MTSAQAKPVGAGLRGAAKESYGYPTAYAEPIVQGEVMTFGDDKDTDDYY